MTSGIDRWVDVRERIERMKEAEIRGANLAPIDFASRDLLDDADALLVLAKAVKESRTEDDGFVFEKLGWPLIDEAYAALPEHLK